jgi:hypothetical protein
MSEIVNDLKLANLEISSPLGINLSNQEARIKHTGSGALTISSYGAGAINGIHIDSFLTVDAATTLNDDVTVNGTLTVNGITQSLITSVQAIVELPDSSTAASLTTVVTTLADSDGDNKDVTLANGTAGQIKIFTMVTKGGAGVITVTPATRVGYSSIEFNNVGDSCMVVYTASGWSIVSNYGCTIGA